MANFNSLLDSPESQTSPASAAQGEAPTPNIMYGVIKRWPWLILGLTVGLILGFLYHMQRPPVYQSSAQLMVIKNRPELIAGGAGDSRVQVVEDYVAGQVIRLALDAAPNSAPGAQFAAAPSVSLGAGARLIGALLARGAELPAGAPLQFAAFGATAAAPPQAEALKQALSESGVFYESHVAEWAQGERTLDSLRREPQGRIEMPAAATGNTDTNTIAANAAESAGLPDALVPVVKEQLQAVDTRQLGWRGEIWPRQTIELTIAEEEQAGDHGGDAPPAWTTTMKLELPRLGGIQAVLQMHGDSLRIGMRASDEAIPTLRDRGSELTASLAAFGLKLISMRVDEHGAPTA